MRQDKLIREVRAARRALMRRCHNDLAELVVYLRTPQARVHRRKPAAGPRVGSARFKQVA